MAVLDPVIVKRKSIRKYKAEPFSAEETSAVRAAMDGALPLYKDIKTEAVLLPGEEYRQVTGGLFIVAAPYYIIIKSERKDGYLLNAGYLGQNIILNLTEAGIGTCWLGGAKSKEKEQKLPYVISIALGKPAEAFRQSETEAARKSLSDIASGDTDAHADALQAARLAPSAMNKQPAKYLCAPGRIDVYKKKTLLPMLAGIQVIDCGIALANIVRGCPEYKFTVETNAEIPAGCQYMGTLKAGD